MLARFIQNSTSIQYTKSQHLFHQGDEIGDLLFVKKGLLKAYYITESGKEFVKSFIAEGQLIASLSALLGRGRCTFNVVALEDCEVHMVPRQQVLALQEGGVEALRGLNGVLLDLAQKKEKREYEFLCFSAEERYQSFLKEYPAIASRISQFDIAAYLGITPVALSRIKSRMKQSL